MCPYYVDSLGVRARNCRIIKAVFGLFKNDLARAGRAKIHRIKAIMVK